jgi:mRNA-degrading endonuclease RelE of RelBE toxin-antitoxin system
VSARQQETSGDGTPLAHSRGGFRVVYSIEADELIIEVVRVAHRQSVYKK